MSTGGPNIRVGLDVQIFGATQLRRAQAALSALGLTIEDVQNSTVNLNGVQTNYYRGLVRLTGATQASRNAQAQAAATAIQNATANARGAAQIRRTATAANQANAQLRALQRQQQAAARAAQQLANHQARVNATLAARVQAQNNQAALNQANIALRQRNALALQMQRAAQQGNNQAHQIQMANIRQQNALQLQNIRHQQAIQRQQQRNAFAPMTAIGSVGRVIAYDMLRRLITNMYQGFFAVAETLGDWVAESIKFNDEMERAKTVFQGLGMIGTKNAAGQSMTIPEAELSTDPKVRAVLAQSQANADNMIRGLMEISAMTGSDMDEVISSARQLLPDLINKRAKAGLPNPYLEKPEEFNAITQEMVKLASVLKMSDPGGRPLKWHMTAIQELFSGTSGGGKDKGMEAVRSLRAREGIRVGEAEASKLAKAVNAGDLMQASQLITDILERSGQGVQNLSNLMAKTLMPNLDGTITALRIFGMDFTQYIHTDLIDSFRTIRVSLFQILNLDSYKNTMKKLSLLFADQFGDIRNTVFKYLQLIHDDPAKLYKMLEGPIKNLGAGLTALRSVIEGIALFMAGFLGTDLSFNSLTKAAEGFKNSAYQSGIEAAEATKGVTSFAGELGTLTAELNQALQPLKFFNTAFATLIDGIDTILTRIRNPLYGFLGKETGEETVLGDFGKSARDYLFKNYGYINPDIEKNDSILPPLFSEQLTATDLFLKQKTLEQVNAANLAGELAARGSIPPKGMSAYTPPVAAANNIPVSQLTVSTQMKGQPTQVNPTFDTKSVIEGFRNMKPVSFQPKSVGVTMTFQVGEMNVTANDAKQFAADVMSGAVNFTNKPIVGRNVPTAENNPFAGFSAGLGLNF